MSSSETAGGSGSRRLNLRRRAGRGSWRGPACLAALLATAGVAGAGHEMTGRDIAAGAHLYQTHCADCHGAALEGQPDWRVPDQFGYLPAPPHDETGHTWHHDNRLLFDYTRLGGQGALAARGISGFKSGMPGFQDVLSDDEIWDVLAYIRSTWPARQQEFQQSLNPPHGAGD